jgi:hypothetical protein
VGCGFNDKEWSNVLQKVEHDVDITMSAGCTKEAIGISIRLWRMRFVRVLNVGRAGDRPAVVESRGMSL